MILIQHLVNGRHDVSKCNVHDKNDDCKYDGSNHDHDRAALQLTPVGPGNFMRQFVVRFEDIRFNLVHLYVFLIYTTRDWKLVLCCLVYNIFLRNP